MTKFSAMIRGRIHQEYDGECHLTAAEAENIAFILDRLEEASAKEPAAWMDAKGRFITDATKRIWSDQSYNTALYTSPALIDLRAPSNPHGNEGER